MCNNNNGSIIDTIFAGMIMGGFFLLFAVALPILPYLEFIGVGLYYIFTPNSPFGKLIFILSVLFIGIVLYELSFKVAGKKFKNRQSMFLFLYGQSFIVISILAYFTISVVSEAFISFISWGLSEPKETALVLVAMTGCLLLYLSYKQELETRVMIVKQNRSEIQQKPVTYQTLISDAKEYLTGEKVERNLATAERLLYKAKQLGGDDATKEVQLVIKKYGIVGDILKY